MNPILELSHDELLEEIDTQLEYLVNNYLGVDVQYSEMSNEFTPNYFLKKRRIRVLKIGNGKNKLVSLYGMHGDEKPSIEAFTKFIPKIYQTNIDLEKVSYTGILANPHAVWNSSRYNDVYEGKFDLNRGWIGELSRPKKDLLSLIKKETENFNVILLDHHSLRLESLKFRFSPFFVLSEKAFEYTGFNGKIKENYKSLIDFISSELRNQGFKIPKETHFKKPYEVSMEFTLLSYLAREGMTAFAIENPIGKYEKMVDLHITADIAALKYLSLSG